MRRPPELTAAEFNVMKVLWKLGTATVADTRAELTRRGGNELAYTTVMTLLGRLATKGAVQVDKSREPFVYQPAFRRESVLRERLRDFLHQVFDGEADSLVLRLVEDESLSLDELRDIERRIETAAPPDDDGDGGGAPARKEKP
jgi:BlaI family penicillinase repressor